MEINSHFLKKALGSLVFLLSFWVFFPLNVLAATNYGDGNYGGGNYNVGDLPTPTPTTVPSNTNSGSSSSTSAPGCSTSVTTGVPDLFEIHTTKNTATLYFAPPPMPYSNFYIAYSTKSDSWQYGTQYDQGFSSGVLRVTINALQPNTTYYFKIRSGNGCMAGNWGNTMTVTTTSSTQTKTYYKNTATTVVQQTKAVVNTFLSPIKKFINNLIPTPKPTVTTAPSIINVQTPAQVPAQTSPQTPKPKFCILWRCF
jgi:Fibronectin type III domain